MLFNPAFWIVGLLLRLGTYAQTQGDVVYDTDDPQHPGKLILGTPCLPGFQKDVILGCRQIFDSIADTTDSLSHLDTEEIVTEINGNNTNNNFEHAEEVKIEHIYESLCRPCFEADHLLRCRKIKDCVVSTTTAISGTSDHSDTKLSGNEDTNTNGNDYDPDSPGSTGLSTGLTEEETTSNGYEQSSGSNSNTNQTTSAANSTTERTTSTLKSSSSTLYISDVPLLKTFSPGIITKQTPTTGMPVAPSPPGTITTKGDANNNDSLATTIKTTADVSTAKQAPVVTGDLLKTPLPSSPSPSSSSSTTTNDNEVELVVTTQATITTTEKPCQNFWCYIQRLWTWNR